MFRICSLLIGLLFAAERNSSVATIAKTTVKAQAGRRNSSLPALPSAKRANACADGDSEATFVAPRCGRGALTNVSGRFEQQTRIREDDGWDASEEFPPLRTTVTQELAKTIITRNESPDISFDRSINPYRGCEHGCAYCYARPTHAYLGLSPGLDFETRLFSKTNAAELLERELSTPGYQPKTIAIGTNTDPYQPIERNEKVMRQVLEVLSRANHPVGIVTKSALIARDIDILAPMAEKGLVKVALSVTTLDPVLARKMEPAPVRRRAGSTPCGGCPRPAFRPP